MKNKKTFGSNHEETLRALGMVIEDFEKPLENLSDGEMRDPSQLEDTMKSVEHLYEECLKIRRELSGSNHAETIRAMGFLADCYTKQGKVKEGLKMKQDAYELIAEFKDHDPTVYNSLLHFFTQLPRRFMD